MINVDHTHFYKSREKCYYDINIDIVRLKRSQCKEEYLISCRNNRFYFSLKYKLGCNILYYSLTDIVRLRGLVLNSSLGGSDPCDRYTIRTATHVIHVERGTELDR